MAFSHWRDERLRGDVFGGAESNHPRPDGKRACFQTDDPAAFPGLCDDGCPELDHFAFPGDTLSWQPGRR